MITRISLTNWQCWEKLVLELAPITVIVGPNDHGKSAIIRALRWVCFNQWEGKANEFITHGQDGTQVTITLLDEVSISRHRSGNTNSYEINDQTYKAFGKSVPDSVAKALNISPDSFQDQHDPAFWLTLSSGQAASALNEIFNLTAIDSTISNVSAELRKARTRVTLSKERRQKIRQEYKELSWVTDANQDLQELEQLQQEMAQTDEQIEQLTKQQQANKVMADLVDMLQAGEGLVSLGSQIFDLDEQIWGLQSLMELEESLWELEKDLQAKVAQLAKWQVGRCPLCGK